MALPEGFNDFEHLQDLLRRFQNRQVRDWFADLGDENWEPDVSTPRGSLRHACTHKDDDSGIMTQMRMTLFSQLVQGKFIQQIDNGSDGIGETTVPYTSMKKNQPQVELLFFEDQADVEPGYQPIKGEISFRLPDRNLTSITRSEMVLLGQRIKAEFGVGQGLIWKRGRLMCTYHDWDEGYRLNILCTDRTEGRRMVGKVLDIRNKSINEERLRFNETDDAAGAYPVIPPTQIIMGETVRLPRIRPRADVRFLRARLSLGKGLKKIVLVDQLNLYPEALVR